MVSGSEQRQKKDKKVETKRSGRDNSRMIRHIYSRIIAEMDLQFSQKGHKFFCICDCSYEAGAMSIAGTIARQFAKAGKLVLLVDCNLYSAEDDLYRKMQGKKEGIAEFVLEDIPVKDILSGPFMDGCLYYIGCGDSQNSGIEQILCSPKVRQLLTSVYDMFDLIICVPCPLSAPVSGKLISRFADTVILVSEINRTRKQQLEDAKRQIDELEIPVLGVVATNANKTAWKQYLKKMDSHILG